jgi:hypothetical protein
MTLGQLTQSVKHTDTFQTASDLNRPLSFKTNVSEEMIKSTIVYGGGQKSGFVAKVP